jgi:thiol-disulfide isomerase/thioredoxin
MKNLLLFFLLFVSSGVLAQKPGQMSALPGNWRASLPMSGGELPFFLDISRESDTSFTVFALNGKERLRLDKAFFRQDSLHIPMSLFESEIVVKVSGNILSGRFTQYSIRQRTDFPFSARKNKPERFMSKAPAHTWNWTGRYAVRFFRKDTTQAVGILESGAGNTISGSFLTPTGDYRYLSGNTSGDSLFLSTFDGSHLFLFKAKVSGDTLRGGFWSGKSGYQAWTGVRDDKAKLPDADKLTFLRPGFETVDFSFPDVNGKMISLKEERFKNKAVIVQILGSWCPNCMDETAFLAPWYKKNHKKGVEIIGLAFEKSADPAVSNPKIQRMITRFDIQYPVLLAGTNEKDKASQALPMLNRVMGFPTTIFIDRHGKVRRIHTGFTGPGTGTYYREWTEDFEQLMEKMLSETP